MIRLMRRWLIVLVLLFAGPAAGADSALRFNDVRRVVAFADVHGAYTELVSLLRETGVVDDGLKWRAGDSHLVSLGDLIDRGPDSRKVLDLLMRLEGEARAAGGAVHLVLGNHEVMNIAGDLRYVSPAEYEAYAGEEDDALREAAWRRALEQDPAASRAGFETAFPRGYFTHRAALSPTGRYGAWLLAKPFLITINDTAFAHGGLPEMVARLGLEGTNETLHSELAGYLQAWDALATELSLTLPVAFQERPGAVAGRVTEERLNAFVALQDGEIFTPRGPTWYRGQALCHPYAETENLGAALSRLGVARAVLGHTVSPDHRVMSRFDGRVWLLDTGMLSSAYQGTPAALVFEQGAWSVAYAGRPGERFQPEVAARAIGARPPGLDDDALAAWLEQAEVARIEELDAGITQPQRVTLRKDGVELRAVFKQLSTDFGATNPRQSLDNADRFEFEMAAYKLDRLLSLDLVPVTVPRTIQGHRGILQFWIEDSMNVRHMLEQKLEPQGWCPANDQYNLMNVFDVLIHNTDRTQENALFTREWMLVLIDHSRAFPTFLDNPRLLYRGEIRLPPALAERLRALDRERLDQELGPYLRGRQISAILKRRDRLLEEDRLRSGARQAAAGR